MADTLNDSDENVGNERHNTMRSELAEVVRTRKRLKKRKKAAGRTEEVELFRLHGDGKSRDKEMVGR